LTVESAHYWLDALNPLTWLTTFRRMRSFGPDIVALSWWTIFFAPAWFTLAALQRVFLRRPLVMICHNVLPHEDRRLDRWIARLVLGLATRLIVQSENEKQRLLELLPGKRADVVPLPVFDMFAARPVSRSVARARLNLDQEAPVLLFFGIVREYKGLADLLAALPDIRGHLPDVRLIIAGEFWHDKQAYLQLIERLGIGAAVVIEDRYIANEELPFFFGAADLLVAPYREVTGSAVVQLAVAFDLPVVTTVTVPLRTEADRRLIRITPRGELGHTIMECFARERAHVHEGREIDAVGWRDLVACITGEAA
jgi:glycosyltransferase involved in cell wall biosynthesis